MIIGLGVDSVEIERFVSWGTYDYKQLSRIFSAQEIEYSLMTPAKSAERFAARFAAKEAFFKALSGALPGHGIPFLTVCKHMSVARTKAGAPYCVVDWARLSGLALFSLRNSIKTHISLSHTKTVATALVVLEK